jgi:hypothetical protein
MILWGFYNNKSLQNIVLQAFKFRCARRETRTLKDCTPTASETATFTNFAIRALL